jgi:AbrB family looped-hinge helix DNA binding protein
MPMLSRRRALVTGVRRSSGIGAANRPAPAADGFELFLTGWSPPGTRPRRLAGGALEFLYQPPGTVKDVSVVSRKNQITIPADVMRKAGLSPGDDVRVRSVGPGRVELVKTDELVDEFAGMLDETVYPAGYLDEVRAGWQ